jgi:hypothetical protein
MLREVFVSLLVYSDALLRVAIRFKNDAPHFAPFAELPSRQLVLESWNHERYRRHHLF